MKRSLIQLSPSTSVVSLPSSWIKKNKLNKGDEIEIEEKENKIIVSSSKDVSKKEITIDLNKAPGRLMWTIIDGAYVNGYHSIILQTKDQEQTDFMTKVVRYFPGMIIHSERKNRIEFRDISSDSEEELDNILSRIFNMNIALIEDCIEAVKTKDNHTLERVKYRDYNINSYVSYYLRKINKFGYKEMSKVGAMHSYIKIIEMISDKLCVLFEGIVKEKIDARKEINVFNNILEVYKNIQRIHFGYSQEKLKQLEVERQKLMEKLPKNQHLRQYTIEIYELFFDLIELETQLHI